MTVNDFIEAFNEEHDNTFEASVLLKWINQVEAEVYEDNQTISIQYYPRVYNHFQFPLPTGITSENIVTLFVNGQRYKKKDARAYKEPYSYWVEGTNLCIYPACSDTDNSYSAEAGEITFTGSTIVTTGDDFTFSVGDLILISGSTSNDKYATIIGVADKTLTFADNTFIAGAEVNEITISVPNVKMTYIAPLTAKLITNIATDTLLLPARFQEAYEYFILSKIALNEKEYGDYQNYSALYNTKVAEYLNYVEEHRPQRPIEDIVVDY